MKEIGGITLSRMNNSAHFVFTKNVLTKAEANSAVTAKAATQLDAFRKAVAVEDELLVISQKSNYSEEIANADAERDALYNGYRNAVRNYLNMPIPAFQQAARTLAEHIKLYGINTAAQYDRETGLIMNLITDLEKKYSEEVDTLNLKPVVEKMKVANDLVNEYLLKREDEFRTLSVGALRNARKDTDDAYYMLVKMVNALALVFGEEAYTPFINSVNEAITRYKREVLKQSSTTKPEAGGTPETPADPGTDPTPEDPGTTDPEKPENPGTDPGTGGGTGTGDDDEFV